MQKEKLIVSACLLGEACRYDGTSKMDLKTRLEPHYELIPFCPEAPAFGTPRPTIDLHAKQDGVVALRSHDKVDVTAPLQSTIERFDTQEATKALLKARSPSCGSGTTKVYGLNGFELGDGLATIHFKKIGITVYDEESIEEII